MLPLLQVYGPITSAVVHLQTVANGFSVTGQIPTVSGYVIPAGHFLQINTRDKTVLYDGDPTQPVGNAIDWQNYLLIDLTPQMDNVMSLTGQTTTGSSQVIATWNDGYLT